jgi:cation/acetate symporter
MDLCGGTDCLCWCKDRGWYGFSGSSLKPGGLVYVLGWTGGFCFLALLLVLHLRSLNLYGLAEFFAIRYDGVWPR